MPGFDPREFLQLAHVLGGGGHLPYPSACSRSAISRAYYSAFLSARDRIEAYNGRPLPRRGVHDTVWRAMAYGQGAVKTLGLALRDLKKLREDADYTMTAVVDSTSARDALSTAERILQNLPAADMTKCSADELRRRR